MKKFGLTIVAIISLLVLSGCCLQHQWEEATCGTPRTCLKCGKVDGEPTEEHVWIEADCNTTKHCSVCKKYEGNPLGHEWKDATCTEAKICMRCGEVGGEALGHQYDKNRNDFLCSRCGEEKLFDYSEMDSVLYGIESNYKEFYDTYVGKKMLMKIKVNGGIDNSGRIVDNGFAGLLRTIPAPEAGLPYISAHITYAPAENNTFSAVEQFDYLIVRAKLDDVLRGWFDGQYYVEFRDTEIIKDSWE